MYNHLRFCRTRDCILTLIECNWYTHKTNDSLLRIPSPTTKQEIFFDTKISGTYKKYHQVQHQLRVRRHNVKTTLQMCVFNHTQALQ